VLTAEPQRVSKISHNAAPRFAARSISFSAALFIAAVLSLPLFADDEVVVTGSRVGGESRSESGSTSVINLDSRSRFSALDEVLEKEAGVRVRRYGGLGSYSTLSIRGSNANQVNVYIDGIPVNNAGAGEVNLSDINIDGAGRIELYRSGVPGEFSGSSIGGSVNIVPDEHAGSGSRLTATGGSFGTYRLSGSNWGGEIGRWNVTGGLQRSDQHYRFRNDNGTPFFNTFDDFDDKRRNSGFRDAFFTGSGSYQIGNTQIKILDDFINRQNGVPGPGNNQTKETERQYWRNTFGAGTDTKGLFVDRFRLQTRAYYTESREAFFDPLQEFSSGSPDSRNRVQQYGAHVMPSVFLPEWNQTLRFFFGLERQDMHSDRRSRFDDRTENVPGRFRNQSSASLEDEFDFFKRRLVITPSGRYQRFADRFNDPSAFTPASYGEKSVTIREVSSYALGINAVLFRSGDGEMYWKTNASSEKRLPTFTELFGEKGSIIGNASLRPESSDSVDTGFGFKFLKKQLPGEISAVVFQKKIRDMILFVPNSQFTLRAENIDSAVIRGLELNFRLLLLDRIRFDTTYTFQNAINTSDVSYLKGKYLPLRPKNEAHGGLTFLFEHWETGAQYAFVGAVYRDRTNDYFQYQPGRWIFNVFLTYSVFGRSVREKSELTLTLEIKNLEDRRVSDITGYPLPGRSIYGTVSYRF